MEIIVVGSGRVGAELAYRLYQRGHKVAVVDNVPASFQNLNPEFRGRTIEGEALNQDVLRRAGIETADGLAAVTNSDAINAAVGHVAQAIYKNPNVIVRNYDARWRPVYEAFNLQIISSTSWGAQRIEELLYHQEMRTVFSAGNGEVEIYEFSVPEAWDGRRIEELVPNQECSIAALTRAGRAILPSCDMIMQQGDIVLVSATFEAIEALRKQLQLAREA